jgi:hypothetical protein
MNNTTIAQLLTLPDGTAIDSVQGTITEVYKQRTITGGKTAQDAKLRDGTGAEIKLTIWEHPDCSLYKGKDVIIQSNKNGLKVKFDNFRPPGVNTLSVSKTCTFQFLEVHHIQQGTAAVKAVFGDGAKQVPATQAPIVLNGAKVGMAINCSTQFMVSAGEAFSPERVHEIASELIRLSNKMEQGELAPAKDSANAPY